MKIIIINILFCCILYSFSFAQNNYKLKTKRKNKVSIVFANHKNKETTENILFEELKINRKDYQFKLFKESKRSSKDGKKIKHRKYRQYYKGVEIENAIVLTHYKDDVLSSIHGNYYSDVTVDCRTNIKKKDAFITAINSSFTKSDTLDKNLLAENEKKGKLVITRNDTLNSYQLVYKFHIQSIYPSCNELVYICAKTGNLIKKVPQTMNILGSGETYYSGTKNFETSKYDIPFLGNYILYDETRNIRVIDHNTRMSFYDDDNIWTAEEMGNDQIALDAFWAATVSHDYLMNVVEVEKYLDEGDDLLIEIHSSNYGGFACPNGVIEISDGNSVIENFVSLDIIGHEIGHILIHTASGLWVEDEGCPQNAIHEGFADVFSACIENYMLDSNKSTWLSGEEVILPEYYNYIRSISDPIAKGGLERGPSCYGGFLWDSSWENSHRNGAVISHWFYLFVEGKNGSNFCSHGFDVDGIKDIDKGARIVYNLLNDYISSNPTYEDIEEQTLNYLQTEYGNLSEELEMAVQAFFAVNMPGESNITCWDESISGVKHFELPESKVDVKNTVIQSGANVKIEAEELYIDSNFEIKPNSTFEFTSDYSSFTSWE